MVSVTNIWPRMGSFKILWIFHHFAASLTWVYYYAPFVRHSNSTIASRCCFHTLVLQTFRSGACGAFFQKALALNHLKSIDFFSFLRVSKKNQSSSLSLSGTKTKPMPADAASIRLCFEHWEALPAARFSKWRSQRLVIFQIILTSPQTGSENKLDNRHAGFLFPRQRRLFPMQLS